MDKNFVNIDDLVRQRLGGVEENERAGAWLQMRDLLDKEMPKSRPGFVYWRRMMSAIAVLVLVTAISVGGYMFATSAKSNTNNDDLAANIPAPANDADNNAVTNAKQISSDKSTNTQNDEHATVTVKMPVTTKNAVPKNSEHNKRQEIAKNQRFLQQLAAAANERNKQLAIDKSATTPLAKNNANDNRVAATSMRSQNADDAKNTQHNTKEIVLSNKPAHTMPATADSQNAVPVSKKRAKNNTAIASNSTPAAAGFFDSKSDDNDHKNNKHEKMLAGKLPLRSNLPLGSNISSAKNIPAAPVAKTINPGTSPISVNSVAKKTDATNDIRQAVSPKNTKPGQGGDNTIIKKEVAAVKMGKKIMDRLVMSEHYVKTSPTEGYFKLDTISIEPVCEELGINNNNDPNHNLPGSSRKGLASNITENDEATQANASTQILPGATASVTGKSAMGIKEDQVSSKGSGTSTIEKLSATFNDIKFHAAGAQFAAGLTAGINGTFFGPNSFKGFQFGFTGNFIFSESLSVLTELKYFHRINNDYSLNDNYYTYTPIGGGQYSKTLQPLSYTFSTLHSIELPVSIHYCMSHFNFFVGGNLVYAFAINTGAAPQPANTNTPIIVSAQGNDNAPKLQPDDFNSRFGLGYLLGISYQVSPNVTLDFRNVQTVWNNGSSQGAKLISNQLYKSPSLQVSVGYRLGGNKKKN